MFLSIVIILIAVSVHEFAHGWVANYLGDPTARLSGRLTLNPFAHLDPIGTLTLFLFGFGWGKPVPIDPYNLRDPRRDQAIISLAGPASNICFAILVGIIGNFISIPFAINYSLLTINFSLAYFNLLPFAPLDGSKILLGLLPFELTQEIEDFLSQYSLILLVGLFLPLFNNRSLVELILGPLVNISIQLLT